MLGHLRTAHAYRIADVLHLGQTLLENVQLVTELLVPGRADAQKRRVDLPHEVAQLEAVVYVSRAQVVDAFAHQFAGEIRQAKKELDGRQDEGDCRRRPLLEVVLYGFGWLYSGPGEVGVEQGGFDKLLRTRAERPDVLERVVAFEFDRDGLEVLFG